MELCSVMKLEVPSDAITDEGKSNLSETPRARMKRTLLWTQISDLLFFSAGETPHLNADSALIRYIFLLVHVCPHHPEMRVLASVTCNQTHLMHAFSVQMSGEHHDSDGCGAVRRSMLL